MQIAIDPGVLKELEYIVERHPEHDHLSRFGDVHSRVVYIPRAVAEGSRRPGTWERRMLNAMGLVVDCKAHHQYRTQYGEPEDSRDESASPPDLGDLRAYRQADFSQLPIFRFKGDYPTNVALAHPIVPPTPDPIAVIRRQSSVVRPCEHTQGRNVGFTGYPETRTAKYARTSNPIVVTT